MALLQRLRIPAGRTLLVAQQRIQVARYHKKVHVGRLIRDNTIFFAARLSTITRIRVMLAHWTRTMRALEQDWLVLLLVGMS